MIDVSSRLRVILLEKLFRSQILLHLTIIYFELQKAEVCCHLEKSQLSVLTVFDR